MNKRSILIQFIGLIVFCIMAAASTSSQDSSGGINYKRVARSAAVGAGAGYNGYTFIGTASSKSQAVEMAQSKGYEYYIWDSDTGAVYGR